MNEDTKEINEKTNCLTHRKCQPKEFTLFSFLARVAVSNNIISTRNDFEGRCTNNQKKKKGE